MPRSSCEVSIRVDHVPTRQRFLGPKQNLRFGKNGGFCFLLKPKGAWPKLVFGTCQGCSAKNPHAKTGWSVHLPQQCIYIYIYKQTARHTYRHSFISMIKPLEMQDWSLQENDLENSRLGTACPLEFLAHV